MVTLKPPVPGVYAREWIDKRFFFKKSEVKELEEGEEDDIFIYSTSCPDEFFPYNRDFVRAQTYIGLMRFGKMKGVALLCIFMTTRIYKRIRSLSNG